MFYLALRGIPHDRSALTRKDAWKLVSPKTNGATGYMMFQLFYRYNVPFDVSEKLTKEAAQRMLDRMKVSYRLVCRKVHLVQPFPSLSIACCFGQIVAMTILSIS